MPDAARVIFLHNPRTGGITLRNALRRQFPGSTLSIPRDAETRAKVRERRAAFARAHPDADEVEITRLIQVRDGASAIEAKRNPNRNGVYLDGLVATWPDRYTQLPLLQDHVWFGLHEHLPGVSTYITLIRDPVDRAVSTYFHHLREGRVRRSLEDYLESGVMLDNEQTLRVSGGSSKGGYEATAELLERAKRNLVEHFAWVGVTERYTESVVLLRRTFGWRPLYFRHQNAAPRVTPGHLPPDLVAMMRERNQLDIELHRFARERLDSGLAEDPGHAAELARFERVNSFVGPLVSGITSSQDSTKRIKGWLVRVLRDVGKS